MNTSLTIRSFPRGGPIISGNGATELFQISSSVSVTLARLRLTGGIATRGGAIDNAGNLVIRASAFVNNQAVGTTAAAGAGGAIYDEPGSRLSLIQSQFTSNQAIDNVPSGGSATGGAIQSAPGSSVLIRGSVFNSNQVVSNQGPGGSAAGGAIADTGATLSIANSRFVGNSASGILLGESGAIHNLDGAVAIANSVFSGNRGIGTGPGATAASGAVTNKSDSAGSATMTIRNSSFTGNQAIAMGTGGDGTTTLSAAFGGAMGTSGSAVTVNVAPAASRATRRLRRCRARIPPAMCSRESPLAARSRMTQAPSSTCAASLVSGNRAQGGAGGPNGSGGAAFGGGIGSFMGQAVLNVTNTVVTANVAQGGGGTFGNGSGGGIAVFQNGRATITNVTLGGNRARRDEPRRDDRVGRRRRSLAVGLGFNSSTPGFVFPDPSSVAIRNSVLSGNAALGGSGSTAGNADGGAIDLGGGTIAMQGTIVSGNTARGGSGSAAGQSGNGSGGGAFAGAGTTFNIQTSTIVANLASAGSAFMGALAGAGVGGGLYIQSGASVFLNGSTFVVANRATTQSSQIFGIVQG